MEHIACGSSCLVPKSKVNSTALGRYVFLSNVESLILQQKLWRETVAGWINCTTSLNSPAMITGRLPSSRLRFPPLLVMCPLATFAF